jgi:uncharacterized membrane protein
LPERIAQSGFIVNGITASASVANKQSDHVTKTIEDILKLEYLDRTRTERIADTITGFFGSIGFIWLHVMWFSLWIIFNLPGWGFEPLDPFPFTFLTMIVSLEAIFLSAFILMSENRQGRLADRRARVNLQIDMISEREITKVMELLVDIHSRLGIQKPVDHELESMQQPTNIEHLTEAAQTAEDQKNGNTTANNAESE